MIFGILVSYMVLSSTKIVIAYQYNLNVDEKELEILIKKLEEKMKQGEVMEDLPPTEESIRESK